MAPVGLRLWHSKRRQLSAKRATATATTVQMNMLVIGFDPGGVSQFGWCVAEARPDRLLRFSRSGVANHAAEAVPAALEKIGDPGQIAAVGIDSPLFWVASGKRRADRAVRAAMNRLGARNIGGTVQQLNSLRGACIVQGIMAARLLRTAVPTVGITESHPKALLWLLKIANNQRRVAEVTMAHLSELITSDSRHLSEHERDAALGTIAAWAMVTKPSGWRDLFLDEEEAFAPVSPIEYWMPIGGAAT